MTKSTVRGFLLAGGTLCLMAALVAQEPPPAGGQKKGMGGGFPRDITKIIPQLEEKGFTPIFDGKTLQDWDCDPGFWKAADGEIVGETTADHQPPQNIFCIWHGGKPADFELRLQYKLSGADTGNSGIQYRSVEMPEVAKWVLKGYQADIDAKQMFTGQVYEERMRGFLALRGQVSYIPDGQKPGWTSTLGSNDELKSLIKTDDWNDITISARGSTLIQTINGRVMSVVIDDDKANRRMDGVIGIQLHKTPNAMKIEARDIRIKNY